MKYKAVIFDLDGTLLNTIDDLADSCNIALTHEGFPMHTVREYKGFVGNGIRHLVKLSLPQDSRTDEYIEILLDNLNIEYLKRFANKTKPYPGIISMLAELEARGIKMSILSNKPHEMVLPIVQQLLHQCRFTVILGRLKNFPHKPNPASTLHIIKQNG